MEITGKKLNNRYQVSDKIAEDKYSTIYHVRDTQNNDISLAATIFKNETVSNRAEDFIRFHSDLRAFLHDTDSSILKTFETAETAPGEITDESSHYLITEHLEGNTLSDFIKTGTVFTADQAINIILQICKALIFFHKNGILHREIRPGNIFIPNLNGDPDFNNLKVTNYGIFHIKEYMNIDAPEEIIETFSYMSPELTGMVKRSIDERSDLYSLGIIFYYLLTGTLPFTGNDIASILHQHVAKQPDTPSAIIDAISQILDSIILKLINKEPDDRYQSAQGLVHDLEKYKSGKREFLLGLDDKILKLNYRTRLIGREEELNKLKILVDKARNGEGSFCFVKGEAGRGKSRLIEELRDYVYTRDGVFIYGKLFSSENKDPYGPFKNALSSYIKIFSNYSQSRQDQIKAKLRESFSDLGQIIIGINPDMKEILGDCPQPAELEPDREIKRFLTTVNFFFQGLGHIENCMVIMLDDLQWTDIGTLELLQEMIFFITRAPLLILGTYRDNEVDDEHVIQKFIDDARVMDHPLTEIAIELFDLNRMISFVSGLLYEKEEHVHGIAEFILQKSEGNPFFAIEILKEIIDAEGIVYTDNRWTLNHDVLDKLKISSSIIEVVIKRISYLNEKENQVLSYAAIIGRIFDIELLFQLSTLGKKEVVEILDKAIRMQLLDIEVTEKRKIIFVHDRIREAFFDNIDPETRKQLHLQIARTIEKIYNNKKESVIFELAHHYFESGSKEKILEYAYPAGVKSKNDYANDEAIKYYTIAKNILEENGKKGSEIWLECTKGIGEIYLTIGENDKAIDIFNGLIPLITRKNEKTVLNRNICIAHFKKGNWKRCEKYGSFALNTQGERVPINQVFVILALIKELITHILHNIFPFIFHRKRKNRKADNYKLILWSYLPLGWSYILWDTLKFLRLTLRTFNLAESKLGSSRELGMAIGAYASTCMAIPLFDRSLTYQQKAIEMREAYGDQWGVAQSLQWLSYCYEWQGSFSTALEYFEKCYEIFEKLGDIKELSMVMNGMEHCYYYTGDYSRAISMLDRFYEIVTRAQDDYSITAGDIYYSQYYREQGDVEKANQHAKKANAQSREKEIWFNHCSSFIELGSNALLEGKTKEAIEYLEEAKKLYENHEFLKQYTILLYTQLACAYLDDYHQSENISSSFRRAYRKKIKKACSRAVGKTKPWATHHGGALREYARYFTMVKKYKKAEKLFLQSIELYSKHNRRYELALSLYEYSTLLSETGKATEHKSKLEAAYRIFNEIESSHYRTILAARLGIEEDSTSIGRLMDRQRLSSIIKLSQDISSILNLDELLEQVMSKAIEVTGAQRGYLFIHNQKSKSLDLKISRSIIESGKGEYSKLFVKSVFRSGKPLVISDAEKDSRFNEYDEIIEYGLKSILCIPIEHKQQIIGICYLDNPLSSGVFSEADIEILNVLMTQAAISIDNAGLYANLEEKVEERTKELQEKNLLLIETRDALWGEMELAKKIQTILLPRKPEIPGYEITALMQPADSVGGDYYDIINSTDIDWVTIGDVSGHGLPAGLIMMMVQTSIQAILRENPETKPTELLRIVNNVIAYNISQMDEDKYMTITVFGIYKNGNVIYSGNHQDILIFRAASGKVESIRTDGLWLGFQYDLGRKNENLKFQIYPGDSVLLYTDGITEAWKEGIPKKERNPDTDMFGIERLQYILARHGKDSTEEIRDAITDGLKDYTFDDDVTMVILKRLPPGSYR